MSAYAVVVGLERSAKMWLTFERKIQETVIINIGSERRELVESNIHISDLRK